MVNLDFLFLTFPESFFIVLIKLNGEKHLIRLVMTDWVKEFSIEKKKLVDRSGKNMEEDIG